MKENVSVVLGRVGNWVQGTPLNSFSSCLTVFRLLEYQSNGVLFLRCLASSYLRPL